MLAFLSALIDPMAAIQLTDPLVTYGLIALFLLLAILIVIRVCVAKGHKKRRAQESIAEPVLQAESALEEITAQPEGPVVPEEPAPRTPVKPRMPAATLPALASDAPMQVALRPKDVQEYDGKLYVSFDIDISADETHLL